MEEWEEVESDEERLLRALFAREIAAEEKRRQDERDQLQKLHNDKSMLRITLASTFLALIAVAAALWSGWEAHQTRVQDERPYIRTEFDGIGEEIVIPSKLDGGDPTDVIWDATPHVRLKPFGKSPSIRIEVRLNCVLDSAPQTVPPSSEKDARFSFLTESSEVDVYCHDHLLADKKFHLISMVGIVIYHDFSGNEERV